MLSHILAADHLPAAGQPGSIAMTNRTTPLLAAALLAGACSSSPLESELDDLDDARARWEARAIDDYRFQLAYTCECLGYGPIAIEVRDGVIVSAEWAGLEGPGTQGELRAMTVEQMFDRIRASLDEDPHWMRSHYAGDGYPLDVLFDFSEETVDDEWGFVVSAFEAL